MKKLFLALHYRHTNQIVPSAGQVTLQWVTNAFGHTLVQYNEFFEQLRGRPIVMRNKKNLAEQFYYIYGIDRDRRLTAFTCFFRNSIMALGIVACDPSVFEVNAVEAQ